MTSTKLIVVALLASLTLASPRVWQENRRGEPDSGSAWGQNGGSPSYGGTTGGGPPHEISPYGGGPGWNGQPSGNHGPPQLPGSENSACEAPTIYSTIFSTIAGPPSYVTVPGPAITVTLPGPVPHGPVPPSYVTITAPAITVYPKPFLPSTVIITEYSTLSVNNVVVKTEVITSTEACSPIASPAPEEACPVQSAPAPENLPKTITVTAFPASAPARPETVTIPGAVITSIATVKEACSVSEQAAPAYTVTEVKYQTVTETTTEQRIVTLAPISPPAVNIPTITVTNIVGAAASGYTVTVTEKQVVTMSYPAPPAISCGGPAAEKTTIVVKLTETSTYFSTEYASHKPNGFAPTPTSIAGPIESAPEGTVFVTVFVPSAACPATTYAITGAGSNESKPYPPAYATPAKGK